MQQRRESAGSRVLESANRPKSSITPCVVRHLTKVGARIEVPSATLDALWMDGFRASPASTGHRPKRRLRPW